MDSITFSLDVESIGKAKTNIQIFIHYKFISFLYFPDYIIYSYHYFFIILQIVSIMGQTAIEGVEGGLDTAGIHIYMYSITDPIIPINLFFKFHSYNLFK